MSYECKILLSLVVCIFFNSCVQAEIPPYIHVCHRKDPQVKKCIMESIETLRAKLKEGIPELNVPSLEPLPLDEIKMRSGPNQAQINADLSNLKVWDCSLFEITELRTNFKNRVLYAKVNLPRLYFKGDYDMDMNMLILKYKGKGAISGNFTDYKIDLTLKYDLIQEGGKEVMHFPKVGVRLYPGKSILHLEGLFDNDPTLGKGIDEVIRDNSDLFIDEVLPVLEAGLSARLTQISNDITRTFPYTEIFPM